MTGGWSVTDGQLSGTDPKPFGMQTIILNRDLPSDIVVRFRTKMLATGVAELMLHVTVDRYVRVYLYSGSAGVYLGNGNLALNGAADGGASVWEKSYSVEVGTWYTVTVTAQGSNYTIAIDGSTVGRYNDTQGALSPSGRIGFTANSEEVRFDEVKIRRP